MHHIYDGKEFRYGRNVKGAIKIDHALLKVYKPEVRTEHVSHLGIDEDMVLSYLYGNLETFKEIPLAYPLMVVPTAVIGELLIKDVNGSLVMFTKTQDVKDIPLVNRVIIRLPIKLTILDAYRKGNYMDLLDLNIPQVNDMLYRLIDLNEEPGPCDELETAVDLVDIVNSFKRLI